jgi:single-stranded-DNA-specific exonuclease
MKNDLWKMPELPPLAQEAEKLAKSAGVSLFLAQLMLNRNLDSPELVKEFLNNNQVLDWPHPPFEADLVKCFQAIKDNQELIVIHGDYDADGLTGTTILAEYLRSSGFSVEPFLPTRSLGYGLNQQTIQHFADQGAKLLITVDCGVSNLKEIAVAKELGLKVIITDHHGLGQELPAADFILHPQVLKLPELEFLSGVGMAYWLTVLLYPHFAANKPLDYWLELAGIGTIADMTPLRGFNRQLVKAALKQIKKTQRPGLLALLKQKQLTASELDETVLAFRVIPLLNAAGRLQSPMLSLDLLMAEDSELAETLAENLNQVNEARREMCKTLLDEICAELDQNPPKGPIVLAKAGWPFGILGITCSQLVERYGQPTVLLSLDGEIGKASVRAPEGFHVLEALQNSHDLFEKYGGHAQAGGFSIKADRIPSLRQALNAFYSEQGAKQALPQAELDLNLKMVSDSLWHELQQLAPFGAGNPFPSFVSMNVALQKVMPDRKGIHIFAEFSPQLKLKGWNMWQKELTAFSHFNLHYELRQNTWKGRTSLELQLKQIGPVENSATQTHPLPLHKSTQQAFTTPEAPPLIFSSQPDLMQNWSLYQFQDKCYRALPLGAEQVVKTITLELNNWQDGRHWAHKKQAQILEQIVSKNPLKTWFLSLSPDLLGHDWHSQPWANSDCEQLIITHFPDSKSSLKTCIKVLRPKQIFICPDISQLLPPPQFNELCQAADLIKKFPELEPEKLLVSTLSLANSRAQLLLACLSDLEILVPNQRNQVMLTPRRYDLRESQHFRHYQARYQKALLGYKEWLSQPLSQLKSEISG